MNLLFSGNSVQQTREPLAIVSPKLLVFLSTFVLHDSSATLSVLTGIRVVELTQALAAPRASVLLGDFGAVFIKVERHGAGALSSAGPASLK
jgi:hypothetical protein